MIQRSAAVALLGLALTTTAVSACGSSSKAASTAAPTSTPAAAATTAPTAASTTAPAPASATAAATADTAACAAVQKANPSVVGRTYSVGNAPIVPGFETVSPSNPDQIVGFDPDLMAAVAQCAGFKYHFDQMAFDALIPALQAHRIDMVISNLIASPARAKQVDFVLYQQDIEVLLVKKGNPQQINSVADLCGKSIAVFPGTLQQGLAQQQSQACTAEGKPAVRIDTYSDLEGCVQAVVVGRSDTTIDPQPVAENVVAKFPSSLEATPPVPEFHNNIGFAFPTDADAALRTAVLAATTAVQSAGIEAGLLQKWNQSPTVQTAATYLP